MINRFGRKLGGGAKGRRVQVCVTVLYFQADQRLSKFYKIILSVSLRLKIWI